MHRIEFGKNLDIDFKKKIDNNIKHDFISKKRNILTKHLDQFVNFDIK